MAETLGSLCDKLTIIKLKQWHSKEPDRLNSLATQEIQLQTEINEFIADAISGKICLDRLTFAANKVYEEEKNIVPDVTGNIGTVFSKLADVNCALWHDQEKVYEFEKVPLDEKDKVVKKLALLNLQRGKCIDQINKEFHSYIEKVRADKENM
jgi:hypothetical protein